MTEPGTGPLTVLAPLTGRVIELAEVPDPVFAEALVGPGLAVDPDRGESVAVAPVAGSVVKLHPHAYVVVADDGNRGVLVHLGVDTVQLRGEGFELLVKEGEHVEAGQPMVRWQPAAVAAGGRSPVCPVVALDAQAEQVHTEVVGRAVATGEELFTWR